MKVWGFFMLCWIHNCKCHHFFVYCGMNKKYQKYIDYIVNDIELPYLKSLEQYGLKDNEYESVLSKVYNQPVKFVVSGDYQHVYDKKGRRIYYENSDGYWRKWEYDSNGKVIYSENGDGDWYKYEYDTNGNTIYYENSNGEIIDRR